jgi:uncharacterized protein YggU (UPF0235/DUF167 family)
MKASSEMTLIKVRVYPRSRKNEVQALDAQMQKQYGYSYRVYVSCCAEKEKANAEMLRLLSQFLNVPISCLHIHRGQHAPLKTLCLIL